MKFFSDKYHVNGVYNTSLDHNQLFYFKNGKLYWTWTELVIFLSEIVIHIECHCTLLACDKPITYKSDLLLGSKFIADIKPLVKEKLQAVP